MGRGVRAGAAIQLRADGVLALRRLVLSALHWFGRRVLAAGQPALPFSCMVLDRRICSGFALTPDAVGKHRGGLCPMLVLPGEVPGVVAAKHLSAALSGTRDSRSSQRLACHPDPTALGNHSCDCYHNGDDLDGENQLDSGLAGVVHGRDSVEKRESKRMKTSVLLAAFAVVAAAQSQLVDRELQSDKFTGNKVGTSAVRKLVVYLPAGYDRSS